MGMSDRRKILRAKRKTQKEARMASPGKDSAIPDERRYFGEPSEYGRVLVQVRENGWGFFGAGGDPLGYVTVGRLEVADGALS